MVDELRVARLLRSVSDDVATLRAEASSSADRRSDPLWLSGVKYEFITAIEGCIDVAQHLCARQGWGPPSSNADAMGLLARHGVLEPGLADRLRAAVGFRNVLVHGYADVDDSIVIARVQELGDLDEFVSAIATWLRAREGSGGQ